MFPTSSGERPKRVAAICLEEDRFSLAVGRGAEGRLERLDFIEETPSEGLAAGAISNPSRFADALDRLVVSLEQASNVQPFHRIVCGVHGPYVDIQFITRSFRRAHGGPITNVEVDRALRETAERASGERVLLQVLPWRYLLDGYAETPNPVGLLAQELDIEVLGVFAQRNPFSNFQGAFEELGLTGAELMLNSLASARYALTTDELENGVVYLEFAWEECRVSIYSRQRLYFHRSVLPGLDRLADELRLLDPMDAHDARLRIPKLNLLAWAADRHSAVAREFLVHLLTEVEGYLEDALGSMEQPLAVRSWVVSGLLADAHGVVPELRSRLGCPARVARPHERHRIVGHDGSAVCCLLGLLESAAAEPPSQDLTERVVTHMRRLSDRLRRGAGRRRRAPELGARLDNEGAPP
jgi:cell division ATPase FtsA